MNAEGAWFLRVNGSDVDPDLPALAASDRGLRYGDGVFRTMRLRQGRVPAWPRHVRKLAADCGRLGFAVPDRSALERDLADLGARHPESVARITVTSGESARGYRRAQPARLTTLVQASAIPDLPVRLRGDGVTLRLCTLRLARQPALAGVKHLNRLEQVLARAEWTDDEVHEGVMLDTAGDAICGTMSNLFALERARLITPDLSNCGVAGVQRERILDWAATQAIPATVEPLPLARLLAADAIVLSNSVIGVWWVSRLGSQRFAAPAWFDALDDVLMQDD
ncbi:MAG: aminodeoxychorismate lyase [Proteobacteria bacterium]|nr:aminodeoxychorismate lyase [Burkholderiales bacterium]